MFRTLTAYERRPATSSVYVKVAKEHTVSASRASISDMYNQKYTFLLNKSPCASSRGTRYVLIR